MKMELELKKLSKLNILLVDDHSLFREGLKRIFEDYGIKNITEASSGEEALSLDLPIKPDVIFMDLYMKELNGIDTMRKFLELYPTVTIVILTVCCEDEKIAEALNAGACGFLNKDMHSNEIIHALIQLLGGRIALSKPISRTLLNKLTVVGNIPEKYNHDPKANNKIQNLSPREKEILYNIGLGKSNREIGKHLFISESTVKNHIRNIFRKLNVHNRTQAITTAICLGLIPISKR